MEDNQSVTMLMESTTSKIQQLQKAFAELESHRAVTLNMKWKELEEHFSGLQKSIKRRFYELEDQEKEFEVKIKDSRNLLEKREAAVTAKEQASLNRLQKKRDAAVSAISTAREKHRKVSPGEPPAAAKRRCGSPSVVERPTLSVEEKPSSSETSGSCVEDMKDPLEDDAEVQSYPNLINLCEEMNSEGLHKFISDNRKNLCRIKEDLPFALKTAANPAEFVLDSLKDFYPVRMSNLDAKKDANVLGLRRTCIMLMECLSILLMNSDLVCASKVLLEGVKQKAKAIAGDWKPKLDALDLDASNGNSLEAHAFLQLVATFDIASEFKEEELSRFVPMVSRRRQAADLYRSLGLSDQMPGVIEVLVNSGRQIDALNLAFAFELTVQFPPVPLLKSYLKEAKKVSSPIKPGNSSPTAHADVSERELASLKSVIKCIEDHKLEQEFPVDPLLKRVLQLEKAKADKKRATEAAKPQPKRPRANFAGHGPRFNNVPTDKAYYPIVAERYPQHVYDRPYIYPGPTGNHGPAMFSSPVYNLPPVPAHGNYYGNGYQYQVPASYHH